MFRLARLAWDAVGTRIKRLHLQSLPHSVGFNIGKTPRIPSPSSATMLFDTAFQVRNHPERFGIDSDVVKRRMSNISNIGQMQQVDNKKDQK